MTTQQIHPKTHQVPVTEASEQEFGLPSLAGKPSSNNVDLLSFVYYRLSQMVVFSKEPKLKRKGLACQVARCALRHVDAHYDT